MLVPVPVACFTYVQKVHNNQTKPSEMSFGYIVRACIFICIGLP